MHGDRQIRDYLSKTLESEKKSSVTLTPLTLFRIAVLFEEMYCLRKNGRLDTFFVDQTDVRAISLMKSFDSR